MFKINIDVIVKNAINENIVLLNVEDKYETLTLEDWYNFGGNIEGIIERKYIVKNILFSKNEKCLLQFIDFKTNTEKQKEFLVCLKLLNRKIDDKNTIKNEIKPYAKLVSIIVNGNNFNSYDGALKYVETLLN